MLGAAWCYYRSGDDYRARFYTGLAARAGADVRGLRAALSGRPRRAGDELAELAEGLDSKSAGDQVRAVRALLGLGRPAVPLPRRRARARRPRASPRARRSSRASGRWGPRRGTPCRSSTA